MPNVLVFGTHPGILRHISDQLRGAGYGVHVVTDREQALRVIETEHVDVMALGGPTAHRHRDEVVGVLLRRQPWVRVLFPDHPDEVMQGVTAHFTRVQA